MVGGRLSAVPELRTDRLLLRHWQEGDLRPFAALNADPAVMEHLPSTLSLAQTVAMVDRIETAFDDDGYGLWAVEVPGVTPFIGFVGLHRALFEAPFTPAVEVGWRLAREHWGCGYATEAGRAAVAYAFSTLGLQRLVSFTTVANRRSRRVMEKLGMTHDPAEDFDHPDIVEGPLRRHVLYRLSAGAGSAPPD